MSTPLRRIAVLVLAAAALVVGVLPGSASAEDTDTGSITGLILDAGAPVPNVTVSLQLTFAPATIAQTVSDADGQFRFEAAPGFYKVRFDFVGGLVQFLPGTTDFNAATEVEVLAGLSVPVEDSVIPHGSLVGQITNSAGEPATNAVVGITRLDGVPITTVAVDRTGHYELPFVTPRTVNVFASAARASAPRQWVPQQKSRADADAFAVTVGQTTTVDEKLLPLGAVSGRFVSAAGPVPNAGVLADSLAGPAESVSSPTRADGQFRLLAYPGTYRLKFTSPETLDQWAHGQEAQWRADLVTVTADSEVVISETALPIGRISGHLNDSTGQPVAGAGVVIADPARGRSFQAATDDTGGWFATVRPGPYQVRFSTANQAQWAFGEASPATADPVTVVADQETVVDDSLTAPGSLRVRAVDARTGAPRSTFCASATNDFVFLQSCTDTGTVRFDAIGAGTYTVTVADDVFLDSVNPGVRVTSGRLTSLTARMRPGATLAISVTDAVTGAPVGGVCVNGQPADRAASPGEFLGDCTDDAGMITLTRVRPDRFVLFAGVFDGVHGAQWVGPHGGVGSRAAAQVVTTRSGEITKLRVRLDGSGSIAGVVTDRATGAPVDGAVIDVGPTGSVTGSDGRYTLDGLGPYQWVAFFSHPDYAGQWSGGGNNRLTATPIRVRSGQVTAHNAALRRGTTLTGRITGPAGQPPDFAEVAVVNAHTFDTLVHLNTGADGVFTTHVLGPQDVKLLIVAAIDGLPVTVWYRDAVDFGHGRTIPVPASGTKRVDVPIG